MSGEHTHPEYVHVDELLPLNALVADLTLRVTALEAASHVHTEPPQPPPAGPWYEDVTAQMAALSGAARGPVGGTVLPPPVNTGVSMDNISVTAPYAGRSVQAQASGLVLDRFLVENGGSVDPNNTSSRNPAVHLGDGTSNTFRNSIVRNAPWTGISNPNSMGTLIQNCEFDSVSQYHFTYGIAESGNKLMHAKNAVVRDSYFHDNVGCSMWFDGDLGDNNLVDNCLFVRNGTSGGPAVFLELGKNMTVQNSYFLDNGREAVMIEGQGHVVDRIWVKGPQGVWGRNGSRGVGVGVTVTNSYFELPANGKFGWWSHAQGGPVNWASDYNVFKLPSPDAAVFQAGGAMLTFAQWQALGYDLNSVLL